LSAPNPGLAEAWRKTIEEARIPAVYFLGVSLPFCGRGNTLPRIVHNVLNFAKPPEVRQAKDANDLGF
jgi:hypothetical protein